MTGLKDKRVGRRQIVLIAKEEGHVQVFNFFLSKIFVKKKGGGGDQINFMSTRCVRRGLTPAQWLVK